MVTLTPITDPSRLREYYAFRCNTYRESHLKILNNGMDGTDRDAYDDRAMHFGWYVDGKLAGCIRFIEPDESSVSIPMLGYMTHATGAEAIRAHIRERKACGERMIEASRFCLAPEHRGLRTAREFVLAMITTLQPLGFEHSVFDCRAEHAAFYRLMGFATLGPDATYWVPKLEMSMAIFHYDFATLLERNKELQQRLGSTMVVGKAA